MSVYSPGEARPADVVGNLGIVTGCEIGLGILSDMVKERAEFDLSVIEEDKFKYASF